MRNSLRKFLRLDIQAQGLLLQAWIWLGIYRLALRWRPMRDLLAGAAPAAATTPTTGAAKPAAVPGCRPERAVLADRIGQAVRSAAAHTPWRSTCLVQVLAARRLLQRRGIGGAIYVGVAPGSDSAALPGLPPGAQSDSLDAHAWLTCDDRFVTGEAGHDRYTVIASWRWA